MVTKEVERDVTIKNDGHLEIKEVTFYVENGVRVAAPAFRRVIPPGKDVSGEDQELQNIAAIAHTPARVQAYRNRVNPPGPP